MGKPSKAFTPVNVSIPALSAPPTALSLASADVKAILLEVAKSARRSGGDEDLQEALLHAALLGIAEALNSYKAGAGPLAQMLKRAIERRMLDALRAERRHRRRFSRITHTADAYRGVGDRRDDLDILAGVFPEQLLSDDAYEDVIAADQVRKFVEDLPERLRHVVKRIFYDDASQAEVARELGVTPAAITKYLAAIAARGRVRLRQLVA